MAAAISANPIEGIITDLTPTTIVIEKKTIYIPTEKRELIKSQDFKIGEEARVFYARKGHQRGNLINAERIKRGKFENVRKNKNVDVSADQEKNMYIQSDKTAGTPEVSGGGKKTDVHIQTQTQIQPRQWIPENEREYRITLQSVLARAVEIVDAHYESYPDILKGTEFVESLDARCNNVELVTDRILDYVKIKIEKDQQERKSTNA